MKNQINILRLFFLFFIMYLIILRRILIIIIFTIFRARNRLINLFLLCLNYNRMSILKINLSLIKWDFFNQINIYRIRFNIIRKLFYFPFLQILIIHLFNLLFLLFQIFKNHFFFFILNFFRFLNIHFFF